MTKLMNTILTLIVLEYASIRFAETFGCEPESEVGAEGDDYIYSTDEVRFSPEWIRACGQELGLDYDANPLVEEEMTTTRLSKSSFCQRRYRLVRNGRNLVAITESDPTRMWGALLANRSSDPVVSKGIAHSLLVEHYWNESSRKLLRRYMRWLDTEFGTRSKELTDRQIEKLHVSALELHARDPISLLALENGSSKGGGWNQWTLNATAGFNSPSRAVENKRKMVKSKKAKAKARKGGANRRKNLSMARPVDSPDFGSPMGQASMGPAAYSAAVYNGQPRFRAIPNGIQITHAERLHEGIKDGVPAVALRVGPGSLKFLSGISHHFQAFRIRKWEVAWVPRSGTDKAGRVTMAPWYSSESMLDDSVSPVCGNPIVDMSTLPGAREFAKWAPNKVGWLAERATRQVFKLIGFKSIADLDGTGNYDQDESRVPGYMVVEASASEGESVAVGNLWVHYTIDLLDQYGGSGKGLAIQSVSTDDAALALQSARISGDITDFVLRGNGITFLSPGYYTVTLTQNGTSPVEDNDGHLITDAYGDDVTTTRMMSVYDTSDAAIATTANGSQKSQEYTLSSTRVVHVMRFSTEYGDTLTIDALTSGSVTSTYINISKGSPPICFRD